jgi:signal recognition particle subunit SRP54
MEEERTTEATVPKKPSDFTLDEFRDGLPLFDKLGVAEFFADMPGLSGTGMDFQGKVRRLRGILDGMTPEERQHPELLSEETRQRRITRGSGVHAEDLAKLLSGFDQARVLIPQLPALQSFRLVMGLAQK